MELKSKKGLSLISLAIGVIVMLIIAGVLVYQAEGRDDFNELANMQNDIKQLNQKVSTYVANCGSIPKLQPYTNTVMLKENKNPEDGDAYYVIDLSALGNIQLNYGRAFDNVTKYPDATDIYIINEKTHTIYYPKGIEVDNIIYYKLQE